MNSSRVIRGFIWLGLGIIFTAGYFYLTIFPQYDNIVLPPKLLNVVDGDTIVVELDSKQETVRLLAIDTPEFGECYFNEAKLRLLELLQQPFSLERKPQQNRDQYDRLLRYVTVRAEDIGSVLILEGYAEHWDRDQHPKFAEYRQLEAEAKRLESGRWGEC